MIAGKSVVAIVLARGGSKGLPGKNVRLLAGKPLIAWTAAAAGESKYIDRLILSTDDDAIAAAGRAAGMEVPFRRPAELAADDTPSVSALLHAYDALGAGFDYIVLLQPTSPLRSGADIDACLALCAERGAPAAVAVAEAQKSPYWAFRRDESGYLRRLIDAPPAARRQDLPTAYYVNGAVYVAETNWLLRSGRFIDERTMAHVMPQERSIDIDTEIDFQWAEFLIGRSDAGRIKSGETR